MLLQLEWAENISGIMNANAFFDGAIMVKAEDTPLPRTGCPVARFIAAAAILYAITAWYVIFRSLPPGLKHTQLAIGINCFIGAMGCFLLSRRWIAAVAGSIFAGAIYGFSPFALGLAAYHPLAGIPLAMMPWLFCPTAFWSRWAPSLKERLTRFGRNTPLIITALLSALPFAGIVTFFWLLSRPWLGPIFPLPKGPTYDVAALAGLPFPLTMRPHDLVFSFYHVPLAALAMGLCMCFASARLGALLIAGVGFALTFAPPLAQVTPAVWALVPILVGSIIIGLGLEGLAWAGSGDSKWLLFCAAVAAVLTTGSVYLTLGNGAEYGRTALLHAAGLLTVASIYALTIARFRWHPLRWTLLGIAVTVDLLSSGKHIADAVL